MTTQDKISLFGIVPLGIAGVVFSINFWHNQSADSASMNLTSTSYAEVSADDKSSGESVESPSDLLAPPAFIESPISKPDPSPPPQATAASSTSEIFAPDLAPGPDPVEVEVPTFPTEERIWTNGSGKLMLASVLDYNVDKGTVLLRSQQGNLIPNYHISQLSEADREYLNGLVKAGN